MEPGKLCEKYKKSSYKARENWYKARKAVFWPSVVIKVPIWCQESEVKVEIWPNRHPRYKRTHV